MPDQNIINFLIVISIQLIFFIIHAFLVGEQKNIGRYLLLGTLVGLPFGIAFDLIVGLYAGVFTYTIGFPFYFLILNSALSYGFMLANVFLLQNYNVSRLFTWSVLLGLVYESSNYFFPVWEWTFSLPWVEYGVVIFAAYFGLAWIMMCVLQILFGKPFRIIPFTFSFKK